MLLNPVKKLIGVCFYKKLTEYILLILMMKLSN